MKPGDRVRFIIPLPPVYALFVHGKWKEKSPRPVFGTVHSVSSRLKHGRATFKVLLDDCTRIGPIKAFQDEWKVVRSKVSSKE